MITTDKYTKEEIEKLYDVVEKAAVHGSDLCNLGFLVKPGDFYLVGSAANGLLFTFNGLLWMMDGIKYDALLQPHWKRGDCVPIWKVVITRIKNGELTGASSGRTEMIRKENRDIYF